MGWERWYLGDRRNLFSSDGEWIGLEADYFCEDAEGNRIKEATSEWPGVYQWAEVPGEPRLEDIVEV